MAILTLDDCSANRAPGRLLRRIDKLMSGFIERRFESLALDISFLQWIALKVVREGKVTNAGELARELSITTGATTRMIDGLEKHGLLARDRGRVDRRVVHLAITPTGEEAVSRLQQHVVEVWNEVLAEFDQSEVDMVINSLVRVLTAAERMVSAKDNSSLDFKEAAE